ncbi:hypothetical protein GCM10011613_34410 [Cellvibrio zantedeschiae]|uniref:Carotenoid biosynthesis protein n=1 Tax=Cellvibrio zantedeschiae TaxID=1237077 RepID=A0ABQ3BBJ0_9GAMM|nr:hypothetical protein [Cellvibrio zantedeschiae]GGY86405.1 hypothetical protein GCM10011613_34410 [Cellvibrio zantedeschiae]
MSIKKSIITALKQNLLPGLVLQCFALAIVLIYFFVPASQPVYAWFALLKLEYGSLYAFVATAFFGGFIPFMYLWASKRIDPSQNAFALFLFYVIFWGVKGIEVDFFYQLQGYWFGYENNVKTIATKVAVDQFIYSALWAAPTITIPYLWVEYHFNFRACGKALNRSFFLEKIPTVIFSNWLVWIPAVSVVYCMPQYLQIPLFNLVLCFWVLILAVLNKK